MPVQGNLDPMLLNPGPPPVSIEDVVELLRSDTLRGFRIDIETDQLVEVDETAEQARRMLFIKEIGGVLQAALQIEMNPAAPALMPAFAETVLFGVRGWKVGRQMEEVFETAFQRAEMVLAGPKPSDPKHALEEIKLKAEQQKVQIEAQRAQFEAQKFQAEHAARLQEIAQNGQIKNQTLAQNGAIKTQELSAQVQLQREKLQHEVQLKHLDHHHNRTEANEDRSHQWQLGAVDRQHQTDLASSGQEHARGLEGMKQTHATEAATVGHGRSLEVQGLKGPDGSPAPHEVVLHHLNNSHAMLLRAIHASNRPKRIVRDENGRVLGVETIPDQTDE